MSTRFQLRDNKNQSSPTSSKGGYQFWGIKLSNIPSSTTSEQISAEFKKYGDIFSVKKLSASTINIIFQSPKKSTSISDIIAEQKKFKVSPLESPQLPAGKKTDLSSKKSSVTKISLLSNPPVSKSSKYNNLNFDINAKLLAKKSKLSSSAAPFPSPPRIHINKTRPSSSSSSSTISSKSSTSSASTNNSDNNHSHHHEDHEGVFFEAVCKSITHSTTEEQVLDFIQKNIFPSIKDEAVKDGMMMLPGESMAVFELNNKDAINKLTKIINNHSDSKNLQFNGNKFTLQRKQNTDDVPPPNVKGLSITLEDEDDDTERTINSNGVNVVNDKQGSDFLPSYFWDYNLSPNDDDKKEDGTNNKKPGQIYFSLPDDAKKYVAKQAKALNVPKTSFVLMLGIMSQNGPVPINCAYDWKANPNVVNLPSILGNKYKKSDIVPNLDSLTDASDKTISTNKSHNTDPVNLERKKSFNSNNASPIGSIGSTPAAAALFVDATSNGSGKRSSPLSNAGQSKKTKKIVANNPPSTLTKAPLISKPVTKTNNNNNHNNSTAAPQKRMFQYPTTSALGTSSLFANTSTSNLLTNVTNNNAMNTLISQSPRPTGGVSLIRMKSGGNATVLSPTAAAILSPRRIGTNTTSNPPPVVVPNTTTHQNIGNGFSMTNPIGNVTPIHIPGGFGNNNNIGTNGQSPNTGFQSPINYNINTPQSPLGNFMTPVINAFTPTANGLNAITPTANGLNFYWNHMHNKNTMGNINTNDTNTMGNINMDNDPLAPNNIAGPFPFNQQSSNPYVQKQLANNNILGSQINNNNNNMNNNNMVNNNSVNNNNMNNGNGKQSPLSKPPSTFFKYPIPAEEPKSSPSNSNNIMSNGVNTMLNGINSLPSLGQQQSNGNGFQPVMNNMNNMSMNNMSMNNGFGGNNNMNNNNDMNMNNNGMNMNQNDDNCNDDEQQMNEPPSLDEINNMRAIPSVISPNGTTPVVMITNLNEDEIDCDKIFTLCGVFGDVQRVKISYHKRDTAFVQLSNHRQAKHVVTSLNRMQLYGKMIHVNLSRMTRVKLPKDSPNSAMMFPDAKFLTKDYTNCKKHRYSKKGAGGIKYSPLSIGQPSHILHIANLPIQTEAKDLQEFLCGNGIFAKNDNNNNMSNNGHSSGRFNPDDKINAIELIGVNNKLGSCQAFAKCVSVDIACQILIDYHSKEFLGREIKISFATRSHMPSDINKTHKTYSYTAPNKKIGASINSIPSSIPRQNSNSQPPMDSRNNNSNNTNNGDNMSSSSSNNSQHSSLNNNNSGGYDNHHNSHRNNYHNNNMYDNSRHNSVCSTFPKNVINNRDSYMDSYNNPVGSYQTYVVNKPAPPDQDKIFVRQHHHSGGRKYHYKLRINK